MTEKDTNPKDAIGTAKWRQFVVVPFQVIWEVGVGMLEGALKYGRHNYRASGVRASVYVDAALGHIHQFWEGEDLDPDSTAQLHHITKAITSLVVLRDAMMNDFWVDDRPPKIKDLPGKREELQAAVARLFEEHADKNPHHYQHELDGAPYEDVSKQIDDMFAERVGQVTSVEEVLKKIEANGYEIGIDHARIGDLEQTSIVAKVKEVPGTEYYNATDYDIANDEILAEAATEKPTPELVSLLRDGTPPPRNWFADPDFRTAAHLLEHESGWMPGQLKGLMDDDPSQLMQWDPGTDRYDVDHIVEGLTSKQLDNLVEHEAITTGLVKHFKRATVAQHVYDQLLRRVLVRIKSHMPRSVRLDFAGGGTSDRRTRLTNDMWFIAVPGVRVTELQAPAEFS